MENERERGERGRVCKTKLTDKTGAQLLAGLIYDIWVWHLKRFGKYIV